MYKIHIIETDVQSKGVPKTRGREIGIDPCRGNSAFVSMSCKHTNSELDAKLFVKYVPVGNFFSCNMTETYESSSRSTRNCVPTVEY